MRQSDTMRRPFDRRLIAVLALCLSLGSLAAWGGAQPEAPAGGAARSDPPEAADKASAAALEERIAASRAKLEEARSKASAAQTASEAALPAGITGEDLQQRKDLYDTLQFWYRQQLSGLESLRELRRSRTVLQTRMQAWQGFSESPPYKLDLLEQLWGEAYGKTRELQDVAVRQRALETLTGEARNQLKASEQQLRQATEHFEQTQAPGERATAQWRLDQAALQQQVNQAKVLGSDAQIVLLAETEASLREELEFLRRKERLASEHASNSQEELDAKLAQIEAQRAVKKRQLVGVERSKYAAETKLAALHDQIGQAHDRAGGDAQPGAVQAAGVSALQADFQNRKVLADTAALSADLLRLDIMLLDREQSFWKQRHALAASRDSNVIGRTLVEFNSGRERAAAWKDSIITGLDADLTLLAAQQKRLADWKEEYGDVAVGRLVLSAYQERVAQRQATLEQFERVETLLSGRIGELETRRESLSWVERGTSLVRAVTGFAVDLWNRELFTVADTIVVEGETVSGKRSVTVGKVALVVLVITVGFWLIRRLAGLLQRIAGRGAHGDAIRGLLVYRLSYLVLLVLLIIMALTMVNIPLTAFAFLGGTVALAVGFGGQNLANNFISGLILMMERPIRIGDIVEIDGVRGRVVNIGARSCQIRRFDGVEILVPNSMLLEKSVTNVTLSDPRTRLSLRVGVAYGSPTRETERLITDAIQQHPHVLKDPAPSVLFEDFGDSALVFNAFFWVELAEDRDSGVIVSDIRHRIDERSREAGIRIAFPQRDVHLDTSGPIQVAIASPHGVAPALPGTGTSPGERLAKSR